MIAEYRDLSPGYFDLVITDECHRSIYGKWSGVLRHFDGIQLGLTATPCTAADADTLPDPERAVRAGHAAFLRPREADLPLHAARGPEAGCSCGMTVKTAAAFRFRVRLGRMDAASRGFRPSPIGRSIFGCPQAIEAMAISRQAALW